jgi:hypothetical protein
VPYQDDLRRRPNLISVSCEGLRPMRQAIRRPISFERHGFEWCNILNFVLVPLTDADADADADAAADADAVADADADADAVADAGCYLASPIIPCLMLIPPPKKNIGKKLEHFAVTTLNSV